MHGFGNAAAGSWSSGPPEVKPCAVCGHDPRWVVLDPDVWTRLVFAAKESEDYRLRQLIEQAVMGPVRRA